MTEKRFWLSPIVYDSEQRFVRDKNLIGEKSMSNNEVVDLLNDLHEENQTLKNKYEKLQRSGASLGIENDGLISENYELRNEVNKLCGFLTYKGYTNDDFNEWLRTQFDLQD